MNEDSADVGNSPKYFCYSGVELSNNKQHNEYFFDTLLITPASIADVTARAAKKEINLQYLPNNKVCNV